MDKDYEIKNGWILCKIAVMDKKSLDLGIGDDTDWVRFGVLISSIVNVRETDDEEYDKCSTIDYPDGRQFTITVSFDDMVRIVLGEK